ncbi:MAG: glycosyl hydrolase [Solirubrobacterales bacterium]
MNRQDTDGRTRRPARALGSAAVLLALALLLSLAVGPAAGVAGGPAAAAKQASQRAKHKCKKRRARRCHRKKHPKPKLPRNFYGINPNYGFPSQQEFNRMKAGGIASYRLPMYWSNVEYTKGVYNWDRSKVDMVMERAVKARLDVLPFVVGTPYWMNGDETVLPIKSAEQEQAWADFLKAVVHRYGPGGTFWAEHAPGTADPVPARPIWALQIWNEENYHYFAYPASPEDYGELLKVAAQAIRSVDPRIRIVTGGLFGRPSGGYPNAMYSTEFLRRLYQVPGARSSFDAVALHPYASRAEYMKPQIAAIRSIMDAAGDSKKQIWLTEFGWGSGDPSPENSFLRGLIGQKTELVSAYRMLTEKLRRWRIGRTYYFSWSDSTSPHPCNLCSTSGLFRVNGTAKPAWYGLVKLTGGTP